MDTEKKTTEETQIKQKDQDTRIRSLLSNLNDPIMLRRTEKLLQEQHEERIKTKQQP